MQKHSKIAISIVIMGFLGIVGWKFLEPYLVELTQNKVSDAGEKGTLIVGLDGWVGYFPLCSPEFKRRMNRVGYGIRCVDDSADYKDRFKKLQRDEYHFVAATVDSYLVNGRQYRYPGPIVAVLDESKGGDAIIARKAVIANMDELKTAQNVKVAFTPNSPSHHLLKSVVSHFDIESLRSDSNFVYSEGSEQALKALRNGAADIAIVWEPEVSKPVSNNEYVRLLGTEDTQRLIVDILVASQDMVRKQPDLIELFLKTYFSTLKYYRNNNDDLVSDIARHYRIKEEIATSLLSGVEWVSLISNAEIWFGTSTTTYTDQALVDSIDSAITVLLDNGDFNSNPLPNEDPYSLLNSGFVSRLYDTIGHSGGFTAPSTVNDKVKHFSSLSEKQWLLLKEVGSLKARKIGFSSGTDLLTMEGKQQIDYLVEDLKHYPNFRIEIRGHTGTRGDHAANQRLSENRADSVMRYLSITHDIEENRARSVGFGGTRPLKKKPGESNRAYNYRLPRVEIVLLREEV